MRRAKVLALCGFLWFAGCASYSWDYTDDLPSGIDGLTSCGRDGKPLILIRKGLKESWNQVVFAHEKTHVRQSMREASCKAFLRKYQQSGAYRLDTEAEAFCKSSMAVSSNQDFAENVIILILSTNYVTDQPLQKVDSVVKRWCEPERRGLF